MANTVTNTKLINSAARQVNYVTIASDGTEETDLVIYDSSTVAAALSPPRTDPLTCTILKIEGCVSSLDQTSVDIAAYLEFDATTDVLALSLPKGQPFVYDFTPYGGLKNTGGAGITGDITLTTTGLDSGDKIWFVLTTRPGGNT